MAIFPLLLPLAGIRYEHIDFINRRIFVPQTKAGQREQPITPSLAIAPQTKCKTEADKDGWVFPTTIPTQSAAGHRTNMARQFGRAVVSAGLDPKRVTPHTMRHTAITKLVQAGVDLPTIQKISGHKTLSMALRYVRIYGNHIDEAINSIDMSFSITPKLHTPATSTAA
jgi:integrase